MPCWGLDRLHQCKASRAHHADVRVRLLAICLLPDLFQCHHVAPTTERVAATHRDQVRVLALAAQLICKLEAQSGRAVLHVLCLGHLHCKKPGLLVPLHLAAPQRDSDAHINSIDIKLDGVCVLRARQGR